MMLVSMAYTYGPEDDDGRGGNRHRTADGSNRHGFDGAGHSGQNSGRQPQLLGVGGHGQRGFQASSGQSHSHNDGDSKFSILDTPQELSDPNILLKYHINELPHMA